MRLEHLRRWAYLGAGQDDATGQRCRSPVVELGGTDGVSILDAEGEALARLSDQSLGDDTGRFYAPHGITVDSRGDIYVAEVSLTETYAGLIAPLTDPTRERRSLRSWSRRSNSTTVCS